MTKILVVDDEKSIREMLEIYLQREGYAVSCACDGLDALARCEQEPFDVVIADIKMPRMDGITLLQRVRDFSPQTIFIMITAFASYETARESMHEDAYDYITKPFYVEDIKRKIDAALEKRSQAIDPRLSGEDSSGKPRDQSCGMIGQSPSMKKVLDLIGRAASVKSNVLITGESGTGKELVARAIYSRSKRSELPFIVINCGGIPETLLESELFGYKKGAFTGAIKDKMGFLEASHGGTLFLDEVGELPLSLQVKLLRMVQEKTFTPVGGTDEIKVDVRIISATNKNLAMKVADGSFREDLYYRLNVINIALPPLRERREDIPLLAKYFLERSARDTGKNVSEISDFALDCLMRHDFPGNIRELENIIERGVALSTTSIMLPEGIGVSCSGSPGDPPPAAASAQGTFSIPPEGVLLDALVERYEKGYVEEALKQSKGSITGAAKLLGITLRSMRYRIQKLVLDESIVKKD
jgi:two-component system, NtrC family, response regulator PilR